MSGRQRYERPDGAVSLAHLSMAVTVWSDGTCTASLASWASGERIRHYRAPLLRPAGDLAPVGIEGLILCADWAFDAWSAGELR